MADQTFERYQCWDEQRISVVINKEAVSVDRATFLATHTPLDTIAYLNAPRQIKDTSETNLLKELRSRAENDQHTFAVIQGIPGTGKSHLIRWLKERYATINQETDGRDVVLLIERANSSLRSTLLQIIQSDVFDSTLFADQIERLKRATDQLSKKGLADTVLNNLQVATNEVTLKETEQPSGRISRNIEKFLLDYVIRDELKRSGGPIERIVRFLSGEGRAGLADDEMPTFHADDFNFQVDFLRQIKNQPDGYREAKNLADSLNIKPELRTELATYLNRLLNFAVGRTTSLSADELKQIFNDLRRELRQQGRRLALFIEDIAVFTGLDAGLVDVLATQHTGEGNREFCRLLSVVGITDSYYHDHFPDNMKERITHRLTLNTSNLLESQLLTSADAVADMAARYLNAIRLSQDELESWQQKDAQPELLPNRCHRCQFKPTCHDAFGFVEIGETAEDGALRVGLYPFNQQALWTMYTHLDTSKISRTPRSLLNNVIEYVLQSHGWQVKEGQFPPVARDLGGDFTPPTLEKPTQRTLITGQSNSPSVANRIETVILFWGNRTVDVTIDANDQQRVSGLRREVFEAFGLPVIKGEGVTGPLTPPIKGPDIKPPPPPPPPPPTSPITQDIERWRTGKQLQYYEKLAKGLADLVGSFIDWEAYGIPASLVDDRLKQARFVIEGQAGRATRSYYLYFKRSDELALVLHAIADLQESDQPLTQGQFGSHLATLSRWLRGQELRIVEFVKQPNSEELSPLGFTDILLQNNLLISCLGDGLEAKKSEPTDIFFKLVEADRKPAPWGELITVAQESHSSIWVRSMRNIERNVALCRREFFPAFNCAQGGSKDLRFINAATILDLLEEFTVQNWQMKAFEIKPDGELWTAVFEVYKTLKLYFAEALSQDYEQVQDYQLRLEKMIGKNSSAEVFEAISTLLTDLRQMSIGYIFEEDPTLIASRLEELRTDLQTIPAKEETVQLALWLSGSSVLVRDTKKYLGYLEGFHKLTGSQEKQLTNKINAIKSGSDETPLERKVEDSYAEIRESLSQILKPVVVEEK